MNHPMLVTTQDPKVERLLNCIHRHALQLASILQSNVVIEADIEPDRALYTIRERVEMMEIPDIKELTICFVFWFWEIEGKVSFEAEVTESKEFANTWDFEEPSVFEFLIVNRERAKLKIKECRNLLSAPRSLVIEQLKDGQVMVRQKIRSEHIVPFGRQGEFRWKLGWWGFSYDQLDHRWIWPWQIKSRTTHELPPLVDPSKFDGRVKKEDQQPSF
jgi:hypothetical protein